MRAWVSCAFLGWVWLILLNQLMLAGEVRGRVIITRSLTKKRVIVPRYEQRGAAVYEPPATDRVDEFQKMAIYLEGRQAQPGTPATAEIGQKNRRFNPDVVVVPVGSSVSFPNADLIFHNVFSLSKARSFDLGHYPAGETRSVVFSKPGIVQVHCHLHPNMSASILVVPNRHYTRPDFGGKFELTGVAPGEYKIVTWHKSAGLQSGTVQVPTTGAAEVNVLFPIVDKK